MGAFLTVDDGRAETVEIIDVPVTSDGEDVLGHLLRLCLTHSIATATPITIKYAHQ